MSDRATRIAIGIGSLFLGPVAPVFYTIGANILLGEAAAALKGNSRRTLREAGLKGSVQGEDEPLKLVFGETRVGGNVLCLGTSGAKNEYFHYVQAHSLSHAGGIDSLGAAWFDDRKVDSTDLDGDGDVVTGLFNNRALIHSYLGTDSQTYDTTLESALAYWETTATVLGVAYTYYRIQHDGSDGAAKVWRNRIPQFTRLVRGIKCYDPRLDSTNGGSGTHRLNDVDTWAWTNNPPLVIGTYMLMAKTDGGCGIDSSLINWTQIAATANTCEESITVPDNLGGSTTQNRYMFNGVLDTADGYLKNIQKVLDSMAGAITYSEGKYNIFAGEYTTPTITIEDDWLVGIPTYSGKRPLDELRNAVKATYVDPLANYNVLECVPFTDSTYKTNDSGQFWDELDLTAGVQDRYQAQQLCAIRGRRSRHMKSLSARLNTKGMALKVWDVVTVDINHPRAINDTFRVMDLKFDPKTSTVLATLLEENDDTYDFVLADFTETVPKSQPSAQLATPPAPTSVTATAVADGIEIRFTPPGASEYSEVEIHRATSSGGVFTKIGEVRGSAITDPITDGATYYYKARSRSATKGDTYSAFTAEVSATAKTVADGADVTADNTSGRGVNVCHPRYSVFSEFGLPPLIIVAATAAQSTTNAVYGTHCLKVTTTSTATGNGVNLTPSSTEYNIPTKSGQFYICSFFAASSTAGHQIRPTVKRSSGSFDDGDIIALTTTMTRYSYVFQANSTAAFVAFFHNISGVSGREVFIDGVMIEELVGNDETPSAFSYPAGAAGVSAVAAEDGRLADQRSALAIVSGNYGSNIVSITGSVTGAIIEAADVGTDCTIYRRAHTLQFGFGQISYDADTVTAVPFNAVRYMYCDDPNLEGGAKNLLAATSQYTPQSNQGFVYHGKVTCPGDTGGTSGGGTSGACVVGESWVDDNLQAKDVARGDILLCWSGADVFERDVHNVADVETVPCVRIETVTGAAITCSVDTPIEQPDGRTVYAANMHGGRVLTEQKDGSFQWELVKVPSFVGPRPVVPISVGGISFAASDVKGGRRIVTHNMAKPLD